MARASMASLGIALFIIVGVILVALVGAGGAAFAASDKGCTAIFMLVGLGVIVLGAWTFRSFGFGIGVQEEPIIGALGIILILVGIGVMVGSWFTRSS